MQELDQAAKEYLIEIYGNGDASSLIPPDEESKISWILERVRSELTCQRPKRYAVGLALDFLALSSKLSLNPSFNPSLDERNLFEEFPIVESRGGTKANTLTLRKGDEFYGIRSEEERVRRMFYKSGRTQYPSAYVYNTGQWPKYKDLLVACFSLSKMGRRAAASRVIALGYEHIQENHFLGTPLPNDQRFARILSEFPRSISGENGGLIWQAICYGFLLADRTHLQIVASGTRTGSRRQSRIGDIDCYSGKLIALTAEVKDIAITKDNFEHQLIEFSQAVSSASVQGMVMAKCFDEESKRILDEAQILTLDIPTILSIVSMWDSDKQEAAVKGMLFFCVHIEGNQSAGARLEEFIEQL